MAGTNETNRDCARGHMPAALRRFAVAIALLTAVCLAAEAVAGLVLHLGHPYNSPFVAPQSRFCDLLEWLQTFAIIHSEAFFHATPRYVYPSPLAVPYTLLASAGRGALACYLLSALMIFGTASVLFARRLARTAAVPAGHAGGWVLLLALTSYPVGFLLYVANLELYLFAALAAGLWFYRSERLGWAGACFGLAASMKLYPAIFLLLLLERRAWRPIAVALLTAIAATLAGLWLEFPNVLHSWQMNQAATAYFFDRDALHRLSGQIGYDHSLFALWKAPFPDLTGAATRQMWAVYLVLVAGGALVLWFARGRRLPWAEQLTVLTTLMILLPPVSYNYTLVHLYAPFACLALGIAAERQPSAWPRNVALGAFAVLFTPQAWLIAGLHSYDGQVKCGALLVLLVTAAAGFGSRNEKIAA